MLYIAPVNGRKIFKYMCVTTKNISLSSESISSVTLFSCLKIMLILINVFLPEQSMNLIECNCMHLYEAVGRLVKKYIKIKMLSAVING